MVSTYLLLISSYLITGIYFFGRKTKTYSHLRHTISELGESGSIYEKRVGFGLFFPVGILLILISFLNNSDQAFHGLSLCIGAGYLVAAFFPCDKGSPLDGSWKQQIHNLGGFIEYVGGTYFIYQSSEELFSFVNAKIIAIITVLCTVLLSIPSFPLRGLVQRIAELILLFTLIALVR